jgi:hypothetical protein
MPSVLTPLQESEFRRKQAEAQVRDAEKRKVVFDADPSPDAEITSEAIDPEAPLGIMDVDGNLAANLMDVTAKASSKERIIDVGLAEKCVTDVRELVGSSFQSHVFVVTPLQARSSHENGIDKTQALPPTQPMIDEDLDLVPATQASALAGISNGVETQFLKNMFDSLPPSSQVIESDMLGWLVP